MKKNGKGTQCTIIWYFNLKMLHVDSDIISSALADIESEYGKVPIMAITWVKIQKYLGMTMDYSSSGKVKLSMVNSIRNILDDIP